MLNAAKFEFLISDQLFYKKADNINTYLKIFIIKYNLVKDLIKEEVLLIVETNLSFET